MHFLACSLLFLSTRELCVTIPCPSLHHPHHGRKKKENLFSNISHLPALHLLALPTQARNQTHVAIADLKLDVGADDLPVKAAHGLPGSDAVPSSPLGEIGCAGGGRGDGGD